MSLVPLMHAKLPVCLSIFFLLTLRSKLLFPSQSHILKSHQALSFRYLKICKQFLSTELHNMDKKKMHIKILKVYCTNLVYLNIGPISDNDQNKPIFLTSACKGLVHLKTCFTVSTQ